MITKRENTIPNNVFNPVVKYLNGEYPTSLDNGRKTTKCKIRNTKKVNHCCVNSPTKKNI